MYIVRPVSKKAKAKLPVGVYQSTVKSIGFHQDYADEDAILVQYELVAENGSRYEYSETFWNDEGNLRTAQFFDYIDELDAEIREDGLPDIVGLKEEVVLKKRQGYSYPVIISRDKC